MNKTEQELLKALSPFAKVGLEMDEKRRDDGAILAILDPETGSTKAELDLNSMRDAAIIYTMHDPLQKWSAKDVEPGGLDGFLDACRRNMSWSWTWFGVSLALALELLSRG